MRLKNNIIESTKSWVVMHRRKVWYHLRSILESFLSGYLGIIIAQLTGLTISNKETLEMGTFLGALFAASRVGIKVGLALALPQIIKLVKYLLRLAKRIA